MNITVTALHNNILYHTHSWLNNVLYFRAGAVSSPMMPRSCARRDFLVITCLTSGLLLFINIFATLRTPGNKAISRDMGENINETASDAPKEVFSANESNPLPKALPSLPWYMKGGTIRPENMRMNNTGLYPEENPGKDRITDQLMFLPPASKASAKVNLKKILLWNGLSSWGGVRSGRGEFLAQECPVNTCTIITTRDRAGQADLILFKDHFFLPSFKRPPSQIWMVFMLGKIQQTLISFSYIW